ncbi:unnamed protein product [Ostreobium quekettii]|uniref:Uncharacterized protein n=1 Tax=Ostreobium quekettii TaxID=121088 RepID=A0A8S1J0F4_9CHLO|nr:unnamed protein product [Ostreobium quekettii]
MSAEVDGRLLMTLRNSGAPVAKMRRLWHLRIQQGYIDAYGFCALWLPKFSAAQQGLGPGQEINVFFPVSESRAKEVDWLNKPPAVVFVPIKCVQSVQIEGYPSLSTMHNECSVYTMPLLRYPKSPDRM